MGINREPTLYMSLSGGYLNLSEKSRIKKFKIKEKASPPSKHKLEIFHQINSIYIGKENLKRTFSRKLRPKPDKGLLIDRKCMLGPSTESEVPKCLRQ